MLLSTRPGSTLTSSRNGTRAPAGFAPRTRSASRSSGEVRSDCGRRTTICTSSFSRGRCSKSTAAPPTAIFKVCAMALLADAVEGGLFLVQHEPHLGLVGLDIPVGVHDAVGVVEDVDDLVGQRQAAFLVRPIDFRHERLQDGRAGRDFGHGDAGAVFGRDCGDARADALGDVMALGFALALGNEVDLQVGDVGAAAHEVVAHQAVEVEGGGDAGVNLVIRHLRLDAHGGGDFAGGLGGAFQRAAFGHVEDDLELALVVERQHLHLHPAEADRCHGGKEQNDDARQEGQPPAGLAISGPMNRR